MRLIVLLLSAAAAFGQEVLVYPEFQRPSIHGGIIKPDQGGRRREILSPAVPRNGYASFFVVVKLREPGPFRLDVAMNPEGALDAGLYRVWFHKLASDGQYYPDALIPVENTFLGNVPDPENRIPGQTAAAFWLDLFVPRGIEDDRVRVEAVLQAGGLTDVYPMEVRILPIVVPDDDALDAGHNSDSANWLADAYPDAARAEGENFFRSDRFFSLIHSYHRIFYEHRGLFHAPGYGQHDVDWDLYDRHYGPLLDGSAFRDTRRGPKPIRYAYVPLSPDQPGDEAEFLRLVSETKRRFREKGWIHTRLVAQASLPARQFSDLTGVVNHWALSDSILSSHAEVPERLRRRGDIVWFSTSAAEVTEPAHATIFNPLRAWMWSVDGYSVRPDTDSGPDPWFQLSGGRETMVYPGAKFGIEGPIPSVRLKIERNALQDLALLKSVEPRLGHEALRAEIDRRSENRTSDWWPEIRRWIYKAAWDMAPALSVK